MDDRERTTGERCGSPPRGDDAGVSVEKRPVTPCRLSSETPVATIAANT